MRYQVECPRCGWTSEGMKRCSKCGRYKSTLEFYANARSLDGLRPDCKECVDHAARRRIAKRAKRA